LIWTVFAHFSILGLALTAVAALSLVAAQVANIKNRDGIAFALLVVTIITAVGSLFAALFPNVFPSTTNAAFSLTVDNARSSDYTLGVMSWVAAIMLPLVLAYQGWTYWVFKKRVSRKSIPAGSH
jgi:cytochrome d ubiquinol oxidase subunit II